EYKLRCALKITRSALVSSQQMMSPPSIMSQPRQHDWTSCHDNSPFLSITGPAVSRYQCLHTHTHTQTQTHTHTDTHTHTHKHTKAYSIKLHFIYVYRDKTIKFSQGDLQCPA